MSEKVVTVRVDIPQDQLDNKDLFASDVKLSFYPLTSGGIVDINNVTIKELYSWDMLFGIPNTDNTKSYNKKLIECSINLLQGVLSNNSLNNCTADTFVNSPLKRINNDNMSIELVADMRRVVDTLQYMINCYSWNSGEGYAEFDKFEIDSKLGR